MLKSCFAVLMIFSLCSTLSAKEAPLPTVAHVDLTQYLGKWYEIARYPFYFQKGCYRSTATYSLNKDGSIHVLNECFKGPTGKYKKAVAKAWAVDANSNSKLKVQFFWPFSADYWIIDLSPTYQYAVVSEPTRKHLWILARTPSLDKDTYQQILLRLQALGFDTSKLIGQ